MDLKENRDLVGSGSIWLRAIFYNVFIFLAIYICWVKGWVNLLDGIVGFGDLAGLVALLVFTYTSWRKCVVDVLLTFVNEYKPLLFVVWEVIRFGRKPARVISQGG